MATKKQTTSSYNDLYYIKPNVTLKEYEMHKHIYLLGIVKTPEILAYDRDTKIMLMKKINYMNVSDYYGENSKDISPELFNKIRTIIKTLYDNNIVYPDITGYNFIEYNNEVWIIDFEHAEFIPLVSEPDNFVTKFINGTNKWNPRFK